MLCGVLQQVMGNIEPLPLPSSTLMTYEQVGNISFHWGYCMDNSFHYIFCTGKTLSAQVKKSSYQYDSVTEKWRIWLIEYEHIWLVEYEHIWLVEYKHRYEAKVSCILCHQGLQLILAYSWARPAILAAGKDRGGMFLFVLFLHFHSFSFLPCPSLSSHLLSLLSLFSPFLWRVVKPQLGQSTIFLIYL